MRTIFSIVFLACVLGSCQSAHEIHYFKSGGNYYRLRIDEHSFASKARYLSGYFDEKAVDKYFSDMSQPKDTVEWVTSENKNAQLVMILSTNSNSVAEQIGNLASNEELLENVALLSNKDKITQGKVFTNSLAELKLLTAGIINAGNTYIDSATTTNIQQRLKDFLNNLSSSSKGQLELQGLATALNQLNQ